MAVHSWRVGDIPTKDEWLAAGKKLIEEVHGKGIAKLHGTWLAFDLGLAWCVWETDNIQALEAVFAAPELKGLRTELKPIEQVYPE